jgi:hypothetical protein
MQMSDFGAPETSAARAATLIAGEYLSEALINHSIRSWYWAVGFAALEKRDIDDVELLYVAAVLHDVGLAVEFDNYTLAYELAGGHVASALTAGAGWAPGRRARAIEVIVRHNWPRVDPHEDLEGYLLEIATALDISGSRSDELPEDFRLEVLTKYPRLGRGPPRGEWRRG